MTDLNKFLHETEVSRWKVDAHVTEPDGRTRIQLSSTADPAVLYSFIPNNQNDLPPVGKIGTVGLVFTWTRS